MAAATGHDDACVLSDRRKAPFIPSRPYLLSRQQIDAFFTAAATLDTSSPWRWQAPAIFTLMHSCGLRTGETRALQTGHAYLQRHDIDIVWPKGNRSRRLPVTSQVTRVLAACDTQSRARFPGRAAGSPVTEATAAKAPRVPATVILAWPHTRPSPSSSLRSCGSQVQESHTWSQRNAGITFTNWRG
ncbi:MAG: hypothetical protein WAK82_26960 [Streptosporangiaceae bacterium]